MGNGRAACAVASSRSPPPTCDGIRGGCGLGSGGLGAGGCLILCPRERKPYVFGRRVGNCGPNVQCASRVRMEGGGEGGVATARALVTTPGGVCSRTVTHNRTRAMTRNKNHAPSRPTTRSRHSVNGLVRFTIKKYETAQTLILK